MMLLRSLAFNVWLWGITIVICVVPGPFTRGRTAALGLARLWAGLVLGGLRRLCGIDWVLTGAEHLPPSGTALIAPMHQSAFDTIVWNVLLTNFAFVLKRELTRVPLFGGLLLRSGMIPVDRAGGAAALRDLLRAAMATAGRGTPIVIFPEGTRVAPGARVRLQPGVAALADRLGLPVIPVVTNSGHYWGRRAFQKHPGTIRIAVLPPLPAGLPRKQLMERLEQSFAEGYAALRSGAAVDNSVNGTAPDLRCDPNEFS